MKAGYFQPKQYLGRYWLLPCVPLVYAIVMTAIGLGRPLQWLLAFISLALAYTHARSARLFRELWPLLPFAMLYDLLKDVLRWTLVPERVIACGLRALEPELAPGVTLQDFAQAHAHPALDLLFAVPYAIFLYVVVGYAGFLFFRDRPRMRYFVVAFSVGNLIAFCVWTLLPAAPPWYVRAHGCEVDLTVPANAAGLLRVDTLFGVDYFRGFYANSSQVFGAVPSMHCAYPAVGLLTAWHYSDWRFKPLHIFYVLLMFSASVYLDHHWVIDGVLGWLVALLAVLATRVLFDRFGLPVSVRDPTYRSPPVPVETGLAP